jgi:SOS-response transcriptional repressor LexA
LATNEGISLDWLILGRDVPAAAGDSEQKHVLQADLPVFDSADFFEPVATYWSVPRRWLEQEGLDPLETLLVRSADDSMRDTIDAGQLVLVDTRENERDGIYLLRFGDIVRFRRVQRMADGSLRLSSDNPAYIPEVIRPDQREQILIVGYCRLAVLPVR